MTLVVRIMGFLKGRLARPYSLCSHSFTVLIISLVVVGKAHVWLFALHFSQQRERLTSPHIPYTQQPAASREQTHQLLRLEKDQSKRKCELAALFVRLSPAEGGAEIGIQEGEVGDVIVIIEYQ